jgi:hypothetical protein
MTLAPNSEVRLAAGQTVRLQEGSTVDMPQPSSQQLGLGIKANTNELPFTSYTIFRSVPYAAGTVMTGWNFELADRTKPNFQHCLYVVNVEEGVSAKYAIAFNGTPERSSGLNKADFEGALKNCLWFSGS